MSRDEYKELKAGKFKRTVKRRLGLFIDGTGLDRATRRLERKVDLAKLVAGVTAGLSPEVARYYTLVPYEDDARQFAFLDAVERAGLEVVIKRLPPKGVKRQVSMDVHMATDIMGYCYGYFTALKKEKETEAPVALEANAPAPAKIIRPEPSPQNIRRIASVVCPTRELSYAMFMAHETGVETSLADFGQYGTSGGWKGVDRWVDLSTSETIWRD